MNGKNKQARVQILQEKLTEEDIKEDFGLEGPWTRWGPGVLTKEFYRLT